MTPSTTISSVTKKLERALKVVDELRASLNGINLSLQLYERAIVLEESEKSGYLLLESKSRFVCLTPDDSKNDPVRILLEALLESKKKLPSVIILSRSEKGSLTRIESIFQSKIQDSQRENTILINLRWATMLPILEDTMAMVVGIRYQHMPQEMIDNLEAAGSDIGLSTLFDNGEYGGGQLTYQLISRLQPTVTLEITLSEAVIRNTSVAVSLLERLAKL
jgi:hypothetical protein